MKDCFNELINRKDTNSVKWQKQKYSNALPFWVADSDYATSPLIKECLSEVALNSIFGYDVIPHSFNEAVSLWYKRYNSNVNPNWVIAMTGVVLEIRVVLDILTNVGDGIILQTPVYHTFHKLIRGMKRNIIENKLIRKEDTYIMDLNNLEKLFKQGHKVLILCSPHNPVGRMWSEEELSKVACLAKKYNVYVISDEIHSDINITDRTFKSMIDFTEIHDHLFVCNAPSKAFNIAGLSTSYIIIPNDELKIKFEERVQRDALSHPDTFGINALITAYNKCEEYIYAQNKHILKNYLFLKEYLSNNLKQAVVTKLEATYLVWLDLSYLNMNACSLKELFDEAHITFSSGDGFCLDYGTFIRINIACPICQLKEGLERLVGAINEIR